MHDPPWPGVRAHVVFLRGHPLSAQGFSRTPVISWHGASPTLARESQDTDSEIRGRRWLRTTGPGVCHTCETALLSGTVSYAPDPVDDPVEGSALICCSQPRSDLALDL